MPNDGSPQGHDDVCERELVARIKQGDRDAFRQLYDRYMSLVFRYVAVRLGSEQDAEDVTADTFINAWQSFSSFEWRGISVGSWLLRIAHNLVVDRYRKQKDVRELFPRQHGQKEHNYARIENRDVIRQAFDTLNHDEQIILYLYYFEGYLLKEIADFVDKTPNAVRVAKYRALRRMRDALEHA